MALNKADYLRACDAHRDGKRVAILGSLRRDAKTFSVSFRGLRFRQRPILKAQAGNLGEVNQIPG